jgi:GMP synthase (glutamine-hydrolysing)
MRLHVAHTQTVLRLPGAARRIAWSAMDGNQAFVVGDCAWGVQFHPEFDAAILKEYIYECREPLIEEGNDLHHLISRCADTSLGGDVLRRFARIVFEAEERRHKESRS